MTGRQQRFSGPGKAAYIRRSMSSGGCYSAQSLARNKLRCSKSMIHSLIPRAPKSTLRLIGCPAYGALGPTRNFGEAQSASSHRGRADYFDQVGGISAIKLNVGASHPAHRLKEFHTHAS